MKTRLFENTGGNKFRLLKESVNVNESLVASGLKKVFMNAGKSISYNHIESVGMGYIKDINTAKQVALQEARVLAKEYGYKEDEDKARFIKENDFSKLDAQNPSHAQAKIASNEPTSDETDMGNPEEKEEVRIGRKIIHLLQGRRGTVEDYRQQIEQAIELAKELVKMHGQEVE